MAYRDEGLSLAVHDLYFLAIGIVNFTDTWNSPGSPHLDKLGLLHCDRRTMPFEIGPMEPRHRLDRPGPQQPLARSTTCVRAGLVRRQEATDVAQRRVFRVCDPRFPIRSPAARYHDLLDLFRVPGRAQQDCFVQKNVDYLGYSVAQYIDRQDDVQSDCRFAL